MLWGRGDTCYWEDCGEPFLGIDLVDNPLFWDDDSLGIDAKHTNSVIACPLKTNSGAIVALRTRDTPNFTKEHRKFTAR